MKATSAVKTHSTKTRRTRSCKIPRPGQKCPQCGRGKLDYNGLLNLVCPACGYVAVSGGFT